jgi:hypothetical protein
MVHMYQNSVKGRLETADDWSHIPVFGGRPESSEPVTRESAYVLAIRSDGRLAVVRTSQGTSCPEAASKGVKLRRKQSPGKRWKSAV